MSIFKPADVGRKFVSKTGDEFLIISFSSDGTVRAIPCKQLVDILKHRVFSFTKDGERVKGAFGTPIEFYYWADDKEAEKVKERLKNSATMIGKVFANKDGREFKIISVTDTDEQKAIEVLYKFKVSKGEETAFTMTFDSFEKCFDHWVDVKDYTAPEDNIEAVDNYIQLTANQLYNLDEGHKPVDTDCSEDLITKDDIGREYIGKDGGVYEVLKYNPFYQFQFTVVRVDNDNGDIYKVNYNGEGSSVNNSFVKWRDESTTDYSDDFYNRWICAYAEATMGNDDFNKIKDKINKMSFRDLKPTDIKGDEKDKPKGKFELSVTVNDINNSCKNEKLYCLGFSELIEEVSKLTLNKICLTKFVSEQEVFENKGDTLKLSKIIKLNGKELGKVTIKITQLQD